MDCGSVQDKNWEESSQASFQVTLRAAQDEAVSTGPIESTTVIPLSEQLLQPYPATGNALPPFRAFKLA